GGIVGAVHRHDPGAHVIDPSGNKLLFDVVVTVHRHAVEIHFLHFSIGAGHFEFAGIIAGDIAPIHDGFALGSASGLGRFAVRIHPHFYGVAPGAGGSRQELVVL